jgi:three-Cys-motif partner protein
MGSASKSRERDTKTLELFELPDVVDSIVRIEPSLKAIESPVWSENKARIIAKYVKYFIMITHHGTYIDAFAGPQVEAFNDDSWSAKLVLEIEPAWLRRFVLCDVSASQIGHLEQLVAGRRANGDKRKIELLKGDCNLSVLEALRKNPIKPKEATFCLLDQRTFECDWETVRQLSTHKASGNKIELFYFLPVGWLARSISALKTDERLLRWWGRDDVDLLKASGRSVHDVAKLFTDRFKRELGYSSVIAWPIHERSENGRIMYFMIHAADHAEAPKLMNRAYRKATGAMEPMDHLQMELEAAGFDVDSMVR